MPETLEKPAFTATHILDGRLVMRNPETGKKGLPPIHQFWVDESGLTYATGVGRKASLLEGIQLSPAPVIRKGGEFGEARTLIGEIIPVEWYISRYAQEHSAHGVMVSREAVGAALRACAWPDSDSPCGSGGNSKDDDAVFEGKDADGNCIVNLFMRGKGLFKVKIPSNMFLEVVDE